MTKQVWLGISVGVVAGAVFALMLLGYELSWWWVLDTDDSVVRALAPYAQTHPGWVGLQTAISTVFGPVSFRLLALVALVVALQRGARRHAVFLLAAPIAGGLAQEAVKRLVDRPRPDEAVTAAFSSSFPSGHAFGVVVGVASLLYLAWPALPSVGRAVAAMVGALVVLAVGFSRLALVVHHLSDVIAGYALAVLWLLLCFVAVRPGWDPWWTRPVLEVPDPQVSASATPVDTP